MKPLHCKLFGCMLEQYGACCDRCGAYLYDADFLQIGMLEPIFEAWRWFRSHSPHWVRCEHCRKRLWMNVSPSMEIEFCSEKCGEEWMPF